MTLLDFRRVVYHISKGSQNSKRFSIWQYEIHRTAPYGAERPFVLEGKEALVADRYDNHSLMIPTFWMLNLVSGKRSGCCVNTRITNIL